MRKWAIVSQKGGSGKTSLGLHLAVAAMKDGLQVTIIDLDPQRSAEQWSELRSSLKSDWTPDEPVIVHGIANDLDEMLDAAAGPKSNTDLTLIDTPPAIDKSMIYAAAASDLVIVPTRTGVLDRVALKDTLEYISKIGALWKTVVVINGASGDPKWQKDVETLVKTGFGACLLPTVLDQHSDFAASLEMGKGLQEASPRKKSARAVKQAYQELCSLEATVSRNRPGGR